MKLFDVIRNDGNPNALILKDARTDYQTGTKVVVYPSQEAVFVYRGAICAILPPGEHTLSTDNLPILSELITTPIRGGEPFHCELYFVSKSDIPSIPWGTPSHIEYLDSRFGCKLSLGMSGEMSLRITDSRLLLTRLLGQGTVLSHNDVVAFARSIILARIRSYVASAMERDGVNIISVEGHLSRFSSEILAQLKNDLAPFGLEAGYFVITSVSKPEDDPIYRQYLLAHNGGDLAQTIAENTQRTAVTNAETQAQVAQTIARGNDYLTERERLEHEERMAQINAQAHSVDSYVQSAAKINQVTPVMTGMYAQPVQNKFCIHCNALIPANAVFCPQCGGRNA